MVFCVRDVLSKKGLMIGLTTQKEVLFKENIIEILGKGWRRRHQESLSPPRQQFSWENWSDLTIWQPWSLLVTFRSRCEWSITVSFGQFQLLMQQQLLTSCSTQAPGGFAHAPCRSQGGQKLDSVLQI